MFKKLFTFARQNRIQKRSKGSNSTKETGYYPPDFDANSSSDSSQSDVFFVHSGALRDTSWKDNNEHLPSSSGLSLTLGLEDNRSKALAKKNAVTEILLCILISISLFAYLYLTGDYEQKQMSEIKRGAEAEDYSVEIELKFEGESLALSDEITVLPEGYEEENQAEEKSEDDFLSTFARRLVKDLSEDNTGKSLVLPKEKDGVQISWNAPTDEIPYYLLVICVVLCILIYVTRFDKLKHEDERLKAEFANELPNMIMQYILMLNAGLISESAFEELIYQNKGSNNFLYYSFNVLLENAHSTNTSFVSEMYSFACRLGNKEFLRFATLCIEHSHRGSELASKLEAERENSWSSKVTKAKAKAKEAETKLCFPLMLLLISLVIICITPAVIEM